MSSDIQNDMKKIDAFINRNKTYFNKDFDYLKYLEEFYLGNFFSEPSFICQTELDELYQISLQLERLERGDIVD